MSITRGDSEVCVNPLCRRKWKILSDGALPIFCPSCKKSMNHAVFPMLESIGTSNAEYYRSILTLWERIYGELSTHLALPNQLHQLNTSSVLDGVTFVSEFKRCFPPSPSVSDVRNWSSMGHRKTPYTGVITSKYSYLCQVDSHSIGVHFIDWSSSFRFDSIVKFVTFANPSITERGGIPLLIKAVELVPSAPLPVWSVPDRIDFSPPNQVFSRPGWIPDTPASPFFLSIQPDHPTRNPPGPLAQLLSRSRDL
jgi:hypothetical protein